MMSRSTKTLAAWLTGIGLGVFGLAIIMTGDLSLQVEWAMARSTGLAYGLARPSISPTATATLRPTVTPTQTEPAPSDPEATQTSTPIPSLFGSAETLDAFGGSRVIAFVSDRDGNPEIYSLDIFSGETNRLTYSDMADFHPRWSPDGRRLAFTSYRDGGPDIHSMTSTGALRQSLTDADWFDEFPSWSPDGEMILFDSDRINDDLPGGEDVFRLYLMQADGTEIQRLLSDDTDGAVGSFSPDERWVVFQSRAGEGEYQIYTLDLETGLIVRLTHTLARNFRPSWSPDGSQIVFVSERDGQSELYVMNADGTDQRRLTSGGLEHVRGPVWSPDGEWILFNAELEGNTDLYVVNLSGAKIYRLTDHPDEDYHPDWRP
jgi:TolB protein